MISPAKAASPFDFPAPPEFFPSWVREESAPWRGLSDFDILVKAEENSGKRIEVRREVMPSSLWGLHVARGERVMIFLNAALPPFWRRFALFHEIYHVLHHCMGEEFWSRTATPMSSFEHQADLFAWGVLWREWQEGEEA